MYDVDEVQWAMRAAGMLLVAVLAALVAFGFRRRSLFLGAVAGIGITQLLPKPKVYASYQSAEGAVMGLFSQTFWDSLETSLIGGLTGIVIAFVVCRRRGRILNSSGDGTASRSAIG
jgi:hypothetical protein